MSESEQAAPKKPARSLQFLKCVYCRNDKKKCLPVGRRHPQKCQRCLQKGLPCSEPVRSDNSRRHPSPKPTDESLPSVHSSLHSPPLRDPHLEQPTTELPAAGNNGISLPQNTQQDENSSSGGIRQPFSARTPVAGTIERPSANDARSSPISHRNSLKRKGRASHRHAVRKQGRAGRAGRAVQPEDDDDDTDEPTGTSHDHAALRYLACPFYKFDPKKYFRCFRKYELRRYSDVKQHIVRNHTLGDMYCANCWATFRPVESAEFEAHTLNLGCQRQLRPEKLFPHEVAALLALQFDRGDGDESKWFKTWDLLFPGHAHPESAYVESDFAEVLTLHNASMESLFEGLPNLLRSTGVTLDGSNTDLLARRIHNIYTGNLQRTTTRRRLQSQINESQTIAAPNLRNSHGEVEPNGEDDNPFNFEQFLGPPGVEEPKKSTS